MTDLRAALVAIQELHREAEPFKVMGSAEHPVYAIPYCVECGLGKDYPCTTRRLADDALETN